MSRSNRQPRLTAIAAVLVMVAAPGIADVVSERPVNSPTVSADDLGKTVRVTGKLGQELGKVLTITGYRLEDNERSLGYNHEGYEFILQVYDIDGTKLSKPKYIAAHALKTAGTIPEGKVLRLTGYETGEFRNLPPEAFKMLIQYTAIQSQHPNHCAT